MKEEKKNRTVFEINHGINETMIRQDGGKTQPLKDLRLDSSQIPESTPIKFWKEKGSENISMTVATTSDDSDSQQHSIDKAMKKIVGVNDSELAHLIFCEGVTAMPPSVSSPHSYNLIAQSLNDIQPQDSFEARLAVQASVLFSNGLANLQKSEAANRTDHADHYANKAVKFLRLHNETIEALSRYRRGGEQKINVTHALIANQAIVNSFNGEGGSPEKPRR